MVVGCAFVRMRPCAIFFVSRELGACQRAAGRRPWGAGRGSLRVGEALGGGAGEGGADDGGGGEFLRGGGGVDAVEDVVVAGKVGPGAVPLLTEDVLTVFLRV